MLKTSLLFGTAQLLRDEHRLYEICFDTEIRNLNRSSRIRQAVSRVLNAVKLPGINMESRLKDWEDRNSE